MQAAAEDDRAGQHPRRIPAPPALRHQVSLQLPAAVPDHHQEVLHNFLAHSRLQRHPILLHHWHRAAVWDHVLEAGQQNVSMPLLTCRCNTVLLTMINITYASNAAKHCLHG